MKDIILC